MVVADVVGAMAILLGLLAWGSAANEPSSDEDFYGGIGYVAVAELSAWLAIVVGVAAMILGIIGFRSWRAGGKRRGLWLIISALGATACVTAVVALRTV